MRHQIQLLVDHAGLALTVTHWPLPAAAVEQALSALSRTLPSSPFDLEGARRLVQRELDARREQFALRVQVRRAADGLTGFGESYTPGSSVQGVSREMRVPSARVSFAGRLGLRFESPSNSLQPQTFGTDRQAPVNGLFEDSAAVMAWKGWNLQVFSQSHWWGPGWQNSLINGANQPAWHGVGIQRGSVMPSTHPWLGWMGPWSLDVFVAQAQDPLVHDQQPQGFLFSGLRLTLRPWPELELGLSRGMQVAGAGRPSGAHNFVKAFLGQEVNQNPGDPPDSSAQIAGFDARLRCPRSWGACAVYTQWMGEDAAGQLPLPYKFMSLWGLEHVYGRGRYRVFAEYVNTNANSLPWERQAHFPAYLNGVYSQGYTNGARWIGSAVGGGSEVTTLGWVDAQRQLQVKLHLGHVGLSVGAYDPRVNAPHGRLQGFSASQILAWRGFTMAPEISWVHLDQGEDQHANRRNDWRFGLGVSKAF